MSTLFDICLMRKLYNDCKRKAIPNFYTFILSFDTIDSIKNDTKSLQKNTNQNQKLLLKLKMKLLNAK